MTEFEAAFEFVREYAEAVGVAVRWNERLDERSEYRRFCDEHGLQPTAERLALARDIAVAAREYFAGAEEEGALVVEDAGVDAQDLNDVPLLFLIDTLQCHGWRADFLNHTARV
jgi:hypothetical protein